MNQEDIEEAAAINARIKELHRRIDDWTKTPGITITCKGITLHLEARDKNSHVIVCFVEVQEIMLEMLRNQIKDHEKELKNLGVKL